jgi:hypothetical protein
MKKLLFIILILFNIGFAVDNNGVHIKPLNKVYSQQRMGCPNNVSGTGNTGQGGFWGWLSGIFSDIGNAFADVANAIADFFNDISTDDGEGMGEENYGDDPPMDYGYDPTDNSFNLWNNGEAPNVWDDLNFDPDIWGPQQQYIANNLYNYGVYYNNSLAGFPPIADTGRIDTVSAKKVNCDSIANKNGDKLTTVFDSVKNKPDMVRLKDSAINGKKESGLTIIKNGSSYNTWNYQVGAAQAVQVATSSSYHNCVAGVHSHPNGSANTPSPGDLFHLLEGWSDNRSFFADFIIANDGTDLAIMIDDTTRAKTFLANHPFDSTITIADWDSTRRNTYSGRTYYEDYFEYMVKLYNNTKYPIEFVQAYANVVMLKYRFNTGVKMYRRENGKFKELNVKVHIDAYGNEHFTIEICL